MKRTILIGIALAVGWLAPAGVAEERRGGLALQFDDGWHSWLAEVAPMVKAQWASVEELRRSLPIVAKALSQIIAERRRQGVALFRKFAETQEGARHG